jgi:hypothetical protein
VKETAMPHELSESHHNQAKNDLPGGRSLGERFPAEGTDKVVPRKHDAPGRVIIPRDAKEDVKVEFVICSEKEIPEHPIIVKKASELTAKALVDSAYHFKKKLLENDQSPDPLAQIVKDIETGDKQVRDELFGGSAEFIAKDLVEMPPVVATVVSGAAEHLPLPYGKQVEKCKKYLRVAKVISGFLTGVVPVGTILDLLKDKAKREIAKRLYDVFVPERGQPDDPSKRSWVHLIEAQRANQAELQRRLDEFTRLTREWVETVERNRSEREAAEKRRRSLKKPLVEDRYEQDKP